MELNEINEADMALLKQTGLDFNLCGPRILRDLGDTLLFEQPTALTPHAEKLVALMAAVRQDERERCAKICDGHRATHVQDTETMKALATYQEYGAANCASAIRNQQEPT